MLKQYNSFFDIQLDGDKLWFVQNAKDSTSYTVAEMDYIVVNNGWIGKSILKKYQSVGEDIVFDDFTGFDLQRRKLVYADVVGNAPIKKQKGDKLKRSFIRHDSDKTGIVLYSIFKGMYK